MKGWLIRGFLLAALLAAGFWAWHVIFPSPEQVIRKRLKELAVSACVAPNEAPLARMINSQKLSGFFTADVEIAVDVPGQSMRSLSGRDELMRAVMGARSMLSSFQVEFVDIQVVVAPDKQSADSGFTAKANIPGETGLQVMELKAIFKKVGRDWLIQRAETVKTLR